MTPLSILDLCPIPDGQTAADAFRRAAELAQHAEALGYARYWVAEHHGMPGIASAATAVVIGHIAAATRHIRVGAGGIMLPNHSPLVVAEQFGTLESLFPGRIDLGLGRAPGSDRETARALRRDLLADADGFPRDVLELLDWFEPHSPERGSVRAVPGEGLAVPVWILGSSLFGAQLAATLGLPYAFASHFAPAQMMAAVALYRQRFKPSARLAKPHVMLGFSVFAADTDAEARLLASSQQQAFVNLRSGRPGKLPLPRAGYAENLAPQQRAVIDDALACTATGTPEAVAAELRAFIERTGADEVMVASAIHDQASRLRSYSLLMQAMQAGG
ncbi:LLM class flavin-dependent oxidoreductase [Derxia lacustris]|uniref:LLM class flavin-dependent oxidoreductase n=1 Tax=Derxia lacustris TaxID=764842 RepID=UPI000A174AFA|nr:LLM class flavin-dependent oxidoreductase [Derxia lacustris]